jgi:hypothetical protein
MPGRFHFPTLSETAKTLFSRKESFFGFLLVEIFGLKCRESRFRPVGTERNEAIGEIN